VSRDAATEEQLLIARHELAAVEDSPPHIPRPTREKLRVAETAKAQQEVAKCRAALAKALGAAAEAEELQALRRIGIGSASPHRSLSSRRRVSWKDQQGQQGKNQEGQALTATTHSMGMGREGSGRSRSRPRALQKQVSFGSAKSLIAGFAQGSLKGLMPPSPFRRSPSQSSLSHTNLHSSMGEGASRVDPIAAERRLDARDEPRSPASSWGSGPGSRPGSWGGGSWGGGLVDDVVDDASWPAAPHRMHDTMHDRMLAEAQRREYEAALLRQKHEARERSLANHLPTGARSQKLMGWDA